MNNLVKILMQQMGGGTINAIAKKLNVDPRIAQGAIQVAMPMLISALSKNTSSQRGAEGLFGALKKDHDGGILEDLAGFVLGGDNKKDANGILGHIFGQKRSGVERILSLNSGMQQNQSSELLELLAPVVMGAMGKQVRQENLQAQQLAELLSGAKQYAKVKDPRDMSTIQRFLDSDGDGRIDDDLAKTGMNILTNWLGK